MKRFVLSVLLLGAAALPSRGASVPARIDLETALRLAVESNFAIRQARARYAEATGAVTESRAGRLPSVELAGGYTRIDEGRFESIGGQRFGNPDQWQVGVTATQTVYSGGAVGSAVRASESSREAAAADFEAAVQSALLEVRERFFDVLLAREQVEVQEQAVKLLEEELANAKARVEAGSGSPFDQLRAEVALANGQPPLIRARNNLRLAAVELLRVVGLPSEEGAEARVAGELAFTGGEPSLEALLASARANRPEVRQLEKLVGAAEHAVAGARSGTKPVLGVFAAYDVQKSSFGDSFGDTVDGWSVGLQGSWNIFDGKATRGRVSQARSRLDQARLRLDETLLAIDSEVRRAHSSYREASELVIASQKVVTQAEESVRLARSRLDAGAATQLDVLQAQVALTEARTNEALALHDASLAKARLDRAAGLAPLPPGASVEGAR